MRKIYLFFSIILFSFILISCSFITKKYTISFYTNDNNNTIEQKEYEENTILDGIDLELTKDGYTKENWYFDANFNEIVTFPFKVVEDTNMYLKWEKITSEVKYTVTFNSNEGSNINTIEVVSGQKITKPTDPTKDGYIFGGWFKDSALTKIWNFDVDIVTSNLTLYAKWDEDTSIETKYTVTFNSNEGSNIDPIEVVNGGKITKPADPTKDGFVFAGWFKDSALTQTWNFDVDTVNSNLTLYAKWDEIEQYTINFMVDNEVYFSIDVFANELVTKPQDPTKDGLSFIGWYFNDEEFDFNTPINSNLTLVAKFSDEAIPVNSFYGYGEGLYIEVIKLTNTNLSDYKFYYDLAPTPNDSEWIKVDSQLVRESQNIIRCDVVGLKAGVYNIKVVVNDYNITRQIEVTSIDRSGYAHFNTENSIGAYNNDGTLKANAIVIYVTDATKNTVTATIKGKKYTGLVSILQAQQYSTVPLNIRIIGTINAATWNPITYNKGSQNLLPNQILDQYGNPLPIEYSSLDENLILDLDLNSMSIDLANGITKLNNLTNKIKYSSREFDSYYNMCDVSYAQYVTIEGIGCDAKLYQWGFTWKSCSYIEVRNLTFDDYTEDACSFEGPDDVTSIEKFKTGRIWIHHNTFNEGKNNWDVCPEQDKHEGDGATDFKKNAYITLSYNHYYKNHKTGLVGGSDSQHTACITFHHNFYEECNSRLPLGRQANMHMYNNYYYKTTGTNMSIRANGYVLIENSVFEGVNNPVETASGGIVKSYKNQFINCTNKNNATIVDTRDEQVKNANVYSPTFDTDPNIFYYDVENKTTDVTNLLPTEQVAQYCKENSGTLKGSFNSDDSELPQEPGDENEDVQGTKVVINFNDLQLGDITSNQEYNNFKILTKAGKTSSIEECEIQINDFTITKFVNFGGGGSFTELGINFNTSATANITVYYSSKSDGRFAALYSQSNKIIAANPTTSDNKVISYTFTDVSKGEYTVCSSNSGLYFYCIVIEYK